jgi:hypothetical protein
MTQQVLAYYDIKTEYDAITAGVINNTLHIEKRLSPKKSNTEYYWMLSDNLGVIGCYGAEMEITLKIRQVRNAITKAMGKPVAKPEPRQRDEGDCA